MVARVTLYGRCYGDHPEEPGSTQVGSDQCRTEEETSHVHEELLHWMCVEGGHGTRSSPAVVDLVDVLEQERGCVEKSEIKYTRT